MIITNKILRTEQVNWRNFAFLQPDNFKKMDDEPKQKLRQSILSNDFVQTFYIWESNDTHYCLDGYHRCQVLRELEAEGHTIPELLPGAFVDCRSKKEAAKLVAIYSSRYAVVQKEGFMEFLQSHDLSLGDVELEIDIPDLSLKIQEPEPTEENFSEDQLPLTNTPITRGNFFRLGDHYLLCGDSSDIADVTELCNTEGADIIGVFTSPPYAEQRKEQYGGVPTTEYLEWFFKIQRNVKLFLDEQGSFFINIKPHVEDGERHLYVSDLVTAMKREWEWRFTEEYCWTHQGYPGSLAGRFKNQFEPIYHFTLNPAGEIRFCPDNVLLPLSDDHYEKLDRRKSGKAKEARPGYSSASGMGNFSRYGDLEGARPGNVLRANSGAASDHPASFPMALPTFFVKAFSNQGETWYEPFSGSGTTLMACELHNRKCRAMEILPEYCAMIIRRWAAYQTKIGKEIDFQHLNGSLTLEEIINA